MDSEVGRLSKEICLKFPEEDQKAQWLKHCNNNNKGEAISLNVNNIIFHLRNSDRKLLFVEMFFFVIIKLQIY